MSNTVRKPELKPVWAGAALRLDPARLPQEVSYAVAGRSGEVTISIDRRGAVLRKVLPQSGLPISVALPARAFRGIAARAMDHGDGQLTVTLELHHEDPQLCVPLLVSHDLDDVAADWRAWSQAYGIPMLMIEADGRAHPLEEQLGPVRTAAVKPRRRHAHFAERRPRFLVRRRPGPLGVAMRIAGREIIARE